MTDTREEFYRSVATQEANHIVGVSYSDGLDLDSCLLQVGISGNFACAFLSDPQVRELRDALDAFLALPLETFDESSNR